MQNVLQVMAAWQVCSSSLQFSASVHGVPALQVYLTACLCLAKYDMRLDKAGRLWGCLICIFT